MNYLGLRPNEIKITIKDKNDMKHEKEIKINEHETKVTKEHLIRTN